ncbi:hypothetical protein O181_010774 [Austropuccinia psidii MF-1]|uniref:Uncharacterized protein n=1 Tax=Austropuccinia psidii MF-1 TaxID=1389203 RepID=A0A9Q3BRQ0_9BASI|nr:hypothetical protein [Austropuccinia psidii MF-1]
MCLQPDQEQAKTPQSAPKKDFRHHYGRSQSVSEGQGSVNEAQADKLCYSEAGKAVLPSNRAENATRSLNEPLQIHPEGGVLNPGRHLEKLHELLPDCENVSGPSK